MTPEQQAALDKIIASKNYCGVCPDAIRRVFCEALSRYPGVKAADKATRDRLHQMTGAFMTGEQVKRARACLKDYQNGDDGALHRALSLHASTRERVQIGALYDRVFEKTGTPGLIVDLACGLNPLWLGARGYRCAGYDVSGDAAALINEWAAACQWPVTGHTCDLLGDFTPPESDLALLMKLLPVLERQKTGAGLRALKNANARWRLVTFPTKTLGGRGVGMEQNYSDWFEKNVPEKLKIADRFVCTGELCYLLEEIN